MPQNVTLRQNLDFFNQLYNLRFFKNKRDLCDQHQKFDIASPEEKELQKAMYDHLVNKNITRDQKNMINNNHLITLSCVLQFLICKKFLLHPKVKLVLFIISVHLQFMISQYMI